MVEDEVLHLKEKMQILHERVENLERVIAESQMTQLRQMQQQINNLKIVINDIKQGTEP